MRWADILKPKTKNTTISHTNQNTNTITKPEPTMLKNIEVRLDKLENIVKTIIEHLNNKPTEINFQTTNNIPTGKEKLVQLETTSLETDEPTNQLMDQDITFPDPTTNTNP
jgi:hypothetical protein